MSHYEQMPARGPQTSIVWPILVLVLLAVFFIDRLWQRIPGTGRDPSAQPLPVTPRGDLAEDEKATIAIFKNASPSVVHITNLAVRQDRFSLDLLQIPQGTGSGFIWGQRDGDSRHVVTNFHVIKGGDAASVTLADHSTWKARVVGTYPDKDLAVLFIDAGKDRLPPLDIGTSNDLQVGQKVFAIGNPFGLDRSLSTGVISALGREIESVTRRAIKDVIQTDAAINPGNSGGPLLDSQGRLIGVNTAIASPSGAWSGIGFAIPVDEVNRVVPKLIRDGKIIRPGLGIGIVPDRIAQGLGVKGVLFAHVQPGSAAEKAGLRPTTIDENDQIKVGDIIVGIDDKTIEKAGDLLAALENRNVGDTITVTVRRNREEVKLKLTLQALD